MREIGSYEAKTHLPRLLDEVERGESIVITKHNRPVARLVPALVPTRAGVNETIANIKHRRGQRKLGSPMRQLIEKGRR